MKKIHEKGSEVVGLISLFLSTLIHPIKKIFWGAQ